MRFTCDISGPSNTFFEAKYWAEYPVGPPRARSLMPHATQDLAVEAHAWAATGRGSSGLHVAVSVLCLRRFDTAHQYGDEACIEGDLPGQWVDSPRHMSGSIAASMPRPKQKPASQVVVKAKPGAPCLWCAVPDRRRSCRCGQIRRARRYAGLQNGVALLLGHMLVLMLVSVSVSRVCAVCVRGRLPLPRA